MTVKELKEKLRNVGDDVEIEIQCNGNTYDIYDADYYSASDRMYWNGGSYDEIVLIVCTE